MQTDAVGDGVETGRKEVKGVTVHCHIDTTHLQIAVGEAALRATL